MTKASCLLETHLHDKHENELKSAPPTQDGAWVADTVNGFIDLAFQLRTSDRFQMKLTLWRDMLNGAFLTTPDTDDAEVELFAKHTMLVVVARSVCDVIQTQQLARNAETAKGFASWLSDIGGGAGDALIAELAEEVGRYEWRRTDRDHLKDLYHAVIPRDIRHGFGEYYTPDWLARAVCEEVLDPDWRRQVIDKAIDGSRVGPAVLDPSCGSGTFLYHACKLLLETAREHPGLSGNPIGQAHVVNNLVAGIDLHPVAVELARTTKALAFASEGETRSPGVSGVHLGDSLQWSLRSKQAHAIDGNVVVIPTGDADAPIRLPYALVLSDRFMDSLDAMFGIAEARDDPQAESDLLHLLDLRSDYDRKTVMQEFRRFQANKRTGRNHIWKWCIENLVQPLRLGAEQMTRLIGNPPWVVYGKMPSDRQASLREHAMNRNIWAPAKNAANNDLSATFVATCVDQYLAPGGRFGFVMPYAALRARQWGPFRTGKWSSISSDRPAKADLSTTAWDLTDVSEPPFPHANSSVVFGSKIDASRQLKPACSLTSITHASGVGVTSAMGWDEVKPRLEWETSAQWPGEASEEYADRFRQGAILSPRSLLVFDESTCNQDLEGTVSFRTTASKGGWNALRRNGRVEQRFVLKAVFSKHVVPFGISGYLNVVAPTSADGTALMHDMPNGDDASEFRQYWTEADAAYRRIRMPKSEPDLVSQIDNRGKFTARLAKINKPCLVYKGAGSWLAAAVVDAGYIVDSSLYWMVADHDDELHYVAGVFNAPALAMFFHQQCRNSDRHFHKRCRSLSARDLSSNYPYPLSTPTMPTIMKSQKPPVLLIERYIDLNSVKREDVLADRPIGRHLQRIDDAVCNILPDYCTPRRRARI